LGFMGQDEQQIGCHTTKWIQTMRDSCWNYFSKHAILADSSL
jgi:hypothetical protein